MLLTMEIHNCLQLLSIQQVLFELCKVGSVDLGSMLIILMLIIVPKTLVISAVFEIALFQVQRYSKPTWEVKSTAILDFHHIRQCK